MTQEVDDAEDAKRGQEFVRVNEKLKAQYARDAQRVASGELAASALHIFNKEMLAGVSMVWPEIDFDELDRDYDL